MKHPRFQKVVTAYVGRMTVAEVIRTLAVSAEVVLPQLRSVHWTESGAWGSPATGMRLGAVLESLQYRFDVASFVAHSAAITHQVHVGLAMSSAFIHLATATVVHQDKQKAWALARLCSSVLESMILHQEVPMVVQLLQMASPDLSVPLRESLPSGMSIDLNQAGATCTLVDHYGRRLSSTGAEISQWGCISVQRLLASLNADAHLVASALGVSMSVRDASAGELPHPDHQDLLAAV